MNKLFASLAAAVLIGALSSAAQAHGPHYRDGHRVVPRAHVHDHVRHCRDLRRDLRRADRRVLRHHRDYRYHRDYRRDVRRRDRVLRRLHANRCRIDYRHYRRGVAYRADLEDLVLGAVAYGIVREALD